MGGGDVLAHYKVRTIKKTTQYLRLVWNLIPGPKNVQSPGSASHLQEKPS